MDESLGAVDTQDGAGVVVSWTKIQGGFTEDLPSDYMGPKAESDLEKNLNDPCARSLGRSDDIRRGFDWSVIHSIEFDAGEVILIQKIRKNSE